MSQMSAFVLPRAGAVAIQRATVPVPESGSDQLLVRIEAVGVGIHDSYFLPHDAAYPYTIGIEAAGTVQMVGGEVEVHRRGDRVAFVSSLQPKGGTWAEFAVVTSSSLIAAIPTGLDFVRAAAVPVAGSTILRAMTALAHLPDDAVVFIAGASGAIGTLAIQLARQRGWRVAASASTGNHDYLRSLGAEQTVDYRDPTWPVEILRWAPAGMHAALAVQPDTAVASMSVVRDGGDVIAISDSGGVSVRGIRMQMPPYDVDVRAPFAELLQQIADGAIHVEIERIYPFDEAPAALAKVQTRHARGKVVLEFGSAPG